MNNAERKREEARLARVKEETSAWVIKQSAGFSPEEQDAFFEWLAADPEYVEHYTQQAKVWKRLDILADWRPEHSIRPNPQLLDFTPSRKRVPAPVYWIAAGMAAVLALSLFLWKGPSFGGQPEPMKLAEGAFARGYERHVLEDGSVIELNLGAQASVKYTQQSRQVLLDSGEAYFTVAKDAERPFVVTAGGISVQAIGTVFNVQLNKDAVNVLVSEGRVRLKSKTTSEADPAVPEAKQELVARQRSIIGLSADISTSVVETLSEDQMAEQLTWLKQVLDYKDTPLGEIVKEFNRRNYRKIVIMDPVIEKIPLSVTIRPSSIDDFVKLLEITADIHADTVDDSKVLLRAKK